MEWEELVGTKIAPVEKVEVDERIALLVEEYISVEKQTKSLSERTKLLRQQITESLPLQDGDEKLIKTHSGEALIEGRSSFTCSPVKMQMIVSQKYNDADVPDFVNKKYSLTRKVFETLDSATRSDFYEAVTYKASSHKITGSF